MDELKVKAVTEIKENYEYVEEAFEMALEKVQRIGEILCEQQKIIDSHGDSFSDWIRDELPFSKATAWNWMQLHKERARINNAKSIAHARRMLAPAEDEKQEPPAEDKPETKPKGDKPDAAKKKEQTEKEPDKPAGPKKLMTTVGEVVPEDLVEVFERLGEIRDPIAKLNGALKVIRDAVTESDELYKDLTFNAFESAMKNATRQLRHCIPYALCPYCQDRVVGTDTPSGCKACKGTGWVSEPIYKAACEELKK